MLRMIFRVPIPVAKQVYPQAPPPGPKRVGKGGGQRMNPPHGHLRSTRVRTQVLARWDVEIWKKGKVCSRFHDQRVACVGENRFLTHPQSFTVASGAEWEPVCLSQQQLPRALGVEGGFILVGDCPHPNGLEQQGRKEGSDPTGLQFPKMSHCHKGDAEYVVTAFSKIVRLKAKIRTNTHPNKADQRGVLW